MGYSTVSTHIYLELDAGNLLSWYLSYNAALSNQRGNIRAEQESSSYYLPEHK